GRFLLHRDRSGTGRKPAFRGPDPFAPRDRKPLVSREGGRKEPDMDAWHAPVIGKTPPTEVDPVKPLTTVMIRSM
ncbi:hypothetical protein, partial [Streptomyces sp. NPDC005568]|uniref:hypothetical protein n=1 Tax=Streptomyces sp. NPDC005568 TaxID=3156887 RepID=UPI0033A54D54